MTKPAPDGPARQVVLDALVGLQGLRSRIAARLEAGERVAGAEIYGRGDQINQRMFPSSLTWSRLYSVRPQTSTRQLRVSLPNNRKAIEGGMHMVSVLDFDGTTPAARRMVVAEELGAYYFAHAPVQMKVVDGSEVMLQGPYLGGEPSVMVVRTPAVLEAALRYWHAVMATAVPAREGAADTPAGSFTPRQLTVIELMRQDLTDQRIADTLGVSLRTVRGDVAGILRELGVGSRFSAGLRLAEAESGD